jgi:hypothetical protein
MKARQQLESRHRDPVNDAAMRLRAAATTNHKSWRSRRHSSWLLVASVSFGEGTSI